MNHEDVTPILIEAHNADVLIPHLIKLCAEAPVTGFDIETFDEPHDGIKSYRNAKRLVFDTKRTTVAGMSFYAEGDANSYYVNLNHDDVENRVLWEKVKPILDGIPSDKLIICHNAPFELTMMGESLGYEFGDNVICTLQLAVSAYGPDEYPEARWQAGQLGDVKNLFRDAQKLFANWQQGDNMSPDQHELLLKVIAKESTATHSYNGFVKSIAYGYGLKQAVKSWFNFDMATFDDTLGDKEHMGELTGQEVLAYGADDAYWAVKLFYKLLEFMSTHCPNAIEAFMVQENPMIHVYAKLWREGLLVNQPAILDRREVERKEYAEALRELKNACKNLLPFSAEPHTGLMKYDKWYAKKPQELRDRFEVWINSPNEKDDFEQCKQVSSAVTNAWMEVKSTQNKNLSIQHYYQVRLMMYDLMQMRNYISKGKTQSDGDARGNLKTRITRCRTDEEYLVNNTPEGVSDTNSWLNNCEAALDAFNKLAGIEQRVKLYITPYLQLTDPDTDRMYPVLSSKLATRRMAMSYPNGMQLSKRGESTYVRGFYLPDNEDELLVSLDWSQIELVLIGEFSKDPEFFKAYGQLPYQDLHLGAAAEVLSMLAPEINEEMMLNVDRWDEKDICQALLYDTNGNVLDKGKRRGYWRTLVGKGSNFNYWYSGALNTVGDRLGWTSDQMWDATEKYRTRFAVAEAWRVGLIEQAKWDGYVELPDGHRRYREEVTHRFNSTFTTMIETYGQSGVSKFGMEVSKKIRNRAGNQLVNSKIQGSSATLIKKSILKINKEIHSAGFKARFKMPIHDELVYSVNRNEIPEFISMAKTAMCNHPEIISHLKVDSTASVGATFEPWSEKKAPFGQIEVDEAPDILGFEPDSRLTDDEIREAVKYLKGATNG